MLIVRKQSKKEVGEQDKGKARRRASILRLALFSALVAGLLGFFVYNNIDYFSSVGETAVAARGTKNADPSRPPRERRPAAEMLGTPEFFDINDVVPLNKLIEERTAESDTASHIRQAVLSQMPRKDSVKIDTAPRLLIPREKPKTEDMTLMPPEPEPPKTPKRLAAADTAPQPLIPRPSLLAAKPDTANVMPISLAPPPEPASASKTKPGTGSMVISNIRCRLADRTDISINVSVELFYDSKALHEEVHNKRGALTAVLGSVVRKQEFGSFAAASLSAELLDAFNEVLASGQLSGVDIKNFSVVQ